MIPLKKFLTVSGMTAISRILGVVRENILSRYLGASIEMDASLMAIKFPKFFRKCFTEEGFNSVFVPYLTGMEATKKNKLLLFFSSRVFSIITYVMFILSIIVIIFAKYFVLLMAPGFINDSEKLALTVTFTRIMFPGVFFLSLSAVYSCVLVASQKFGWYTISPILINIVLITSIITAICCGKVAFGLAIGLFLATFIQFLYLYIVLRSKHLTVPRLSGVKITPTVRHFFKKLVPIIVSASVAQVNVFIDSFFSSYLATGCVTYLYFADRLNQLPLSLFGISMSIILLPEISKRLALKDNKELPSLYKESILFSLRLTTPVIIIMTTLAYYFIDFVYGYGKFTPTDVKNTAIVLQFFVIGLPAYVLAKVIAAIIFAKKQVKAPVVASLVSIGSNLVLNSLLISKFQFAGIAAATTISGYIQMLILAKYLNTEQKLFEKVFVFKILKIITAGIVSFIGTYLCIKLWKFSYAFENIIVYSAVAAVLYTIMLFLLKDDTICSIIDYLKVKFDKKNIFN